MVFALPSGNSLLEDFCSLGKRQVSTQPPWESCQGLWNIWPLDAAASPVRAKGHSAQEQGAVLVPKGCLQLLARTESVKLLTQRLMLHSIKNILHSGKKLLFLVKLLQTTPFPLQATSHCPSPTVVCRHSRNHFGQAVSTECCCGWVSTGSTGGCAGQPCVSRELGT